MNQENPSKPTCSTRDAAELLGISVRTAQLWVEEGRLSAWKTPGGHRRILRASVDKILAEQQSVGIGQVFQAGILVLDDVPERRQALRGGLAEVLPECVVSSATDAFDGLIRIGECPPAVLITDVSLGGLDGFRMLGALGRSRQTQFTLVIVLTPDEATRSEARGQLPPAVVLMVRPVDCGELAALIRAFLKRPQMGGSKR